MRRLKIYHLLFYLITLFTVGCSSDRSTDQSHPNIVFILIDDMGWSDLPVYGNLFNESPNITQLAQDGMLFTNAYASCPVCSPTRASIQSGQYPARIGITDFITGHWRPYEEVVVPKNRTQYLPLETVTIAERLKEAGYHTGYFGKWHLGWGDKIPTNQGYDKQVVYNGGGFFGYDQRMDPPQKFPGDKVLSEALTDLSLQFIEENKNNPFFLFLAHYDVHVQLEANKELIEKFLTKPKTDHYPCNAVYAAMIEHVDNSVGRVVAKLDELNLSDNTLVIFYSDNGGLISRFDAQPLLGPSAEWLYEDDSLKWIASSNAPLRSEKGTVYEGGVREPLIIKWPKMIPKSSRNNSLVTSVDFYPTFLEITGLRYTSDQSLDGISLFDLITNNRHEYDRSIYWHYPVYHHDQPAAAIRRGDYKLIQNLVDQSLQLYNLADDIGERRNLASELPEKTSELLTDLQTWQSEVHAEFPQPNPNFDRVRRSEWGTHPDRN